MTLIEIINNQWSRYEINMEILFVISLLLISVLVIYFSTKERRFLFLSLISITFGLLFNILGILILNSLFKIQITEIFKMVPLITNILLLSNLGVLVGYYISKRNSKGFKFSTIRREYLNDSIKQTIFLLLLGSSTLLFLSVQTEAVISISVLSSIFSIWCTYASTKYLLR